MRASILLCAGGLVLATSTRARAQSAEGTPAPVAPAPEIPPGFLAESSYAQPGTVEVGGAAGLMIANDFRNITIAPSAGYFLTDNLEVSVIFALSNIKARGAGSTLWTAVAEPSYHLPLNPFMFAFAGLGLGAAYESELGGGLAVSPRLGANFLVGTTGIVTPSLSYTYITHNDTTDDEALMVLTSTLQFNVGYTTMW